MYKRDRIRSTLIRYLFPKKVWLSQSAFVDYAMIFLNSFVKLLLVVPYLIYGLYIAFYTNEYLFDYFGTPAFTLTAMQTVVGYTIVFTLVSDFMSYLVHYLMHKIPFLWEFHKTHHSATTLNPVTQYRIHPVELLINNARSILVFGVLTGLFDYLSNHQVHKLVFLGVNVLSFGFLLFGANLRHSHVKLRYWSFLEYIFISPVQHQIHHSNNPKFFNKNMGSMFALWDWLFGTLALSKTAKNIEFGLGEEDEQYSSFWKNIYMPFYNIFMSVKMFLKRIFNL
ncbi:MAG: sterol desaturase family protein [Aureispira sp.]|nr:sterol desaturase family protein [Aureispira sp.]